MAIIPGGPLWSPLGGSSGACYSTGCGYTGWVTSNYALGETGNFKLEFGVVNWADTAYDTGMAFDGITIAGVPITPINPKAGTSELWHILSDSDPELVLCPPGIDVPVENLAPVTTAAGGATR